MAALTAVFKLGAAHPNRGGLRSATEVQLTEGGRPALTFRNARHLRPKGAAIQRPPILIPTLENTLEDAMLLIAYALSLNPKVEALFNEALAERAAIKPSRHLEMYEAFSSRDRKRLYRWLREETPGPWPKIGLHIYRGSLLLRQASRMANLPGEYEVLLPAFGRSWSAWSGGFDDWDDRSRDYCPGREDAA